MRVWFVLILFVLMSACAPTSTLPSNPTLSVTSVAISAPTPSRVPSATEIPTAPATATNTATPTNTATITQTPTDTQTITPQVPDWQYTNTAIMQTLAAKPTRTQTPRPPTRTPTPHIPGLRDFAKERGLEIGTAPSGFFDFPQYVETLTRNFNLYVSEDFHWKFGLRPDADHFDFGYTDYVVAFAKKNNMNVQGHHLVWGWDYALPDWLLNGNYSREQLLDLIHVHISTVVGHFKGRIKEWSVVNEPFTNDEFWREHIGPDYVENAFRWAKEADPNAILILNQFSNEDRRNPFNQRVTDETYNLIRELKGKGVPIDGVGMQMHLSGNDPPNKQGVIQNMRHFAELGVMVYVTELDVNMKDAPGSTEEKYARQAQIYRDMLEACIESQVCKSFSVFQIGDKYSWLEADPNGAGGWYSPNADPTLFDDDLNPKPAYFAVRDALLGK